MNEKPRRPARVAVVGPGEAGPELARQAEEVGRLLAERGAIVLCGGLGGCMEAAARGVRQAGGLCLGFLPGYDADDANSAVDVPLPTGLGEARNVLVVAGAGAVIAIGGGAGTLSEIAFALKLGRRVVALGTWSLCDPDGRRPALVAARDPAEAVRLALEAALARR